MFVDVLFELQNSDIEPRWSHWQIQWVAGLTLLRTTGHVLQYVDRKRSPHHKRVVSDHWKSINSQREANWIFWEFIQLERNNIIKQFEFDFVTEPYLEPGEYEIDSALETKISLFRESVYWWRNELLKLETQLNR